MAIWAGGTVTNCTEADLRMAMAGGGVVTFACDGTITLSATITNAMDTVLDGSGHALTISGGNAVGIFYVSNNVNLTLTNLTIANGQSTYGAGFFVTSGGTVNLVGAVIRDNAARQEPWAPMPAPIVPGGNGGAIYNLGGTIAATHCTFSGNRAEQASFGSWESPGISSEPCLGGAIDNQGGQLNLRDCVFRNNSAIGGPGWIETRHGVGLGASAGRPGYGGAIYSSGIMTVSQCTFEGNSAQGGSAPAQPSPGAVYTYPGTGATGAGGGKAEGGAVFASGTAVVVDSVFVNNSALGGSGGDGGPGQSLGLPWVVCGDGGPGGQGGEALGGSFFNIGRAAVVNCTFALNHGIGGSGGGGGRGGAVNVPYPCYGRGGPGGRGGNALGGVYNSNDQLAFTNCTVAWSWGVAGGGGPGGPSGNGDSFGTPGTNGAAGGGLNRGSLLNTLLATNVPANCSGSINDLGHNLSSDASCAFTHNGSMNNTDPKLGPPADHGGPTLTMALLPGSPAIDAGDDASAPAVDQRGFPRPIGPASDIGAYEYGSPAFLSLSRAGMTELELRGIGIAGQCCQLLASADLSQWVPIATNQFGSDGTVLFYDACDPAAPCRFYQLSVP